MLGLDYASVDENQPPDFAAVAAYGMRFAIVRGAFTDHGRAMVDPTVARDRAAIAAAGLQFGSYVILGWNVDPADQVAAFVSAYPTPDPGDLPPALDIEFPAGFAATGLTPGDALAKIETALAALKAVYPTVMIYTSYAVWHDDLGDIASDACSQCPCWLKVSYPWKERNSPHPEDVPAPRPLPGPWRQPGSAGVFVEQFQGDALRVPGFSSTVDLNVFRNYVGSTADPRTPWMVDRLSAQGYTCDATDATSIANAIRAFQSASSLSSDGIVGPRTWAQLCTQPAAPAVTL